MSKILNAPDRPTRELAVKLAASLCQGEMPKGTSFLAYIILIETYLLHGGDATAEAMGWEIKEREPINLEEVRASLKNILK